MALSYSLFNGDGSTKDFVIGFSYIETSHVKVTVDKQAVGYTVDGVNKVVRLDTAPATGSVVRLYRETPLFKTYSDFKRGNAFGQSNVNNSFLWQLMLSQELSEGRKAADNVADQDLNMGGFKVINMDKGVADGDAVTVKQLEDRIQDINYQAVIPISQPRQAIVSGQLEYNAPHIKAALPVSFFVQLDGVTQRPVTDYTTDTIGKLTFTTQPPVGAALDIRYFEPNTFEDPSELKVTALGSAIARSLSERFSDVINVLDFGAVGDGVTDCWSAFVAAIAFATTARKSLFVPDGDYYFSQCGLSVTCNMTGGSRAKTRLYFNPPSASKNVLICGTGVQIKHFSVAPMTTNATKTFYNNDYVGNFNYHTLTRGPAIGSYGLAEDIGVSGMQRGMQAAVQRAKDIRVRDCVIYGADWGTNFYVTEGLHITGCEVYGGTTGGMGMPSCTDVIVEGCKVANPDGTGINTGGSSAAGFNAGNITVVGNRVYARDCINLENGCNAATISGNTILVYSSNTNNGVGIGVYSHSGGSVTDVTVTGNTIISASRFSTGIRVGDSVTTGHIVGNVSITGNSVQMCRTGIILDSPTSGWMRGLICTGNTIHGLTKGIDLPSDLRESQIAHNVLVRDSATTISGYEGMTLRAMDDVHIVSNTTRGWYPHYEQRNGVTGSEIWLPIEYRADDGAAFDELDNISGSADIVIRKLT